MTTDRQHGADWAATLESTRLTLTFTPDRPWAPGPELGNTLRGAFGAAVRGVACVRPGQVCEACSEHGICLYPGWFEGPSNAARPFALRVAWPAGERVSEQRPIRVGLAFFGCVPRPSLVTEALHRMARKGLGPSRIPHQLTHALAEGEGAPVSLLDGRSTPIWPGPAPLSCFIASPDQRGDVRVTLVTRVDFGRRLGGRHPTPSDLLLLAKERLYGVARLLGVHVQQRWPRVEEVGGRWERLRRERAWRRSAAQGRPMPMGGWVGTALYPAASIEPFRALLAAAELLQIGGWTTAGLGVVAVDHDAGAGA